MNESERYKEVFKQTIMSVKTYGTDLIMMTAIRATCADCSRFQGRVYSISGKDNRFPKLPDFLLKTYGKVHPGCRHSFTVYFADIQDRAELKSIIAFSNRPFIDSRTEEDKQLYEEIIRKGSEEKQDREAYEWLLLNLPDLAPKSFSGYRKMKNSNTANFHKLEEAAQIHNYRLN